MAFVWDPRKAASNLRKHLVTFQEATTVFDDEHALVQRDLTHADRLLIELQPAGPWRTRGRPGMALGQAS